MSDTNQQPYITLGNHLRYLREQHSESLAEVSGAVEIDETSLASIEAGHERPEEEILMLLISHYNMQDQEAVQLWELAGYDNGPSSRADDILQDSIAQGKPVVVLFGLDARTMYSDAVQVDTSSAGVTLKFGQMNSNRQSQHVAKVGMSYEQAEEVLRQLQAAVLYGRHNQKPKQLPPAVDD
jgi:transcriptional regulator with XRE-family HTH domain